jgi:hypothetical protein
MSEDLMLWIKNNKVSTSIENEEQAYINQKRGVTDMKTTRQKKVSLGPISELVNYDGSLSDVSYKELVQELSLRFPYVCIIDNTGHKYEIFKKQVL